ncbi:L-ascorbate peroxidase 3-like [Solanum dulcamara]|uniref:L-ascorbate peroxidase 3-like n=1 Tax=Solanum dulcamara TaxID=45834 RepID=UPI002485F0C1|nr:L-ascorbate peroxidase 3-like [Solanum dulcamara]
MAAQTVKKFHEEIDHKTRLVAAELAKKYHEDQIDKAREELQELVNTGKLSAFDMLRLAYASQFSIANHHHDDAGRTTSTDDKTKETDLSAKKNYLETIAKLKEKYHRITSRDLYQLAGIVAVKTLKGPDIDFVHVRMDLPISPDESCLPDITLRLPELRDVFGKVKISEPKHIVALYGGLKLARGGAQDAKLKFDDSAHLFKEKDLSPTEKAMLEDKEFGEWVKLYAQKNEDFLKDYKEAHKKLFEFNLPYSAIIKEKLSQVKKAVGVGVVVAAAVVILSVFYVINRRRAKHSSQQFQ